jgi:membrane associated rhomboid family serine protease
MTSGADLFVVCKQCGSEVSPYITECPYCGHRLRRRAPKLPRAHAPTHSPRRSGPLGALLARSRRSRTSGRPRAGVRFKESRWAATRPYATIGLVVASAAAWVASHAEPSLYTHMVVFGPLHGEWWRLVTSIFAYGKGIYAFLAIVTIAIFGWLLERRHGPLVVLALALGAGVSGTLVASAVYTLPWAAGGNGAALALLAAWAAPDLRAARTGSYYEGDLLGAGAIAALLLAIPFAISVPEASWLAGVTGGLVGLLVGAGLGRMGAQEA